jgi:hypothetical protein
MRGKTVENTQSDLIVLDEETDLPVAAGPGWHRLLDLGAEYMATDEDPSALDALMSEAEVHARSLFGVTLAEGSPAILAEVLAVLVCTTAYQLQEAKQ